MGELLYLSIEELVLLFAALGAALLAGLHAKSFGGWFAETFGFLAMPIVVLVRFAEYIASFLKPAYDSVEKRVTGWISGLGQTYKYNVDHAYRNAFATQSVATWANTKLRSDILKKAKAEAEISNQKNALTKAPPLPQRRITQREVDIEFQKLIESLTPAEKLKIYPKWDWDPDDWKKWLGVLPALGGAVVGKPKTAPTPVPAPKPAPVKTTIPIQPPQPTTLPHTDDSPNPEPGTQIIPGVISGKDKVARGQIQTLKKVETNKWKHLGPLAFLAIPAAGISTLIGLLECKNFGKLARGICSIPTGIFNDLLGLLLDTLILADICAVISLIETGFGLVEGPLTDFIGDVGAALCHGDYSAPPALNVPALRLPTTFSLALNLPTLPTGSGTAVNPAQAS